jgi:hypothetical protein
MLDFIKKYIRPFPKVKTKEFEGCLDFFVVLFLEVLSVQWIFEVQKELVVSLETVSDKGEEGCLAGPSHARKDNCLRRVEMPLYLAEYRTGIYHLLTLHKVELFVKYNILEKNRKEVKISFSVSASFTVCPKMRIFDVRCHCRLTCSGRGDFSVRGEEILREMLRKKHNDRR